MASKSHSNKIRKASAHPTALKRALDESTLGAAHWKVWGLSATGVMLDGFDLFVIGIALPLIKLQWDLSALQVGAIACAAVFGSMFGAVFGGVLTDRFGRKAIYLLDLMVFIVGSLLCAFATGPWSLILFRFFLGIGVGADYPICASYVSEFMPSRLRGRMLIGAFSFQAVGIILAALVGIILLGVTPAISDWRILIGFGALPAIIVLILRTKVPESPRWLMEQGRLDEAQHVVEQFVPAKKIKELDHVIAGFALRMSVQAPKKLGYADLFSKKFLPRTILASVPWFLMDIATYAVGVFTPVLLSSLAFDDVNDPIRKDFLSTAGAAGLGIFLVLGFIANMLLVDRIGRMRLQIVGFVGMVVGLGILAWSAMTGTNNPNITGAFSGFMIFNLLMNMGPNATTFVLPAELFPTKIRASAHGFCSAVGKCGALVGLFLLPIVQEQCGTSVTMLLMAFVCMLGLAVTSIFAQETRGRSLEDIEPGEAGITG